MQVNAWLCIQAQAELAYLTKTLPPPDSYQELMNVVELKLGELRESGASNVNIHEHLLKRGVCLSEPEDASGHNSFNASTSESYPPTVVFLCDIEGTTTPLPFVRKVMMPLAASYADSYAAQHFPSDETFVQHVRDAAAFAAASATATPNTPPATPTLSDAFATSEAASFGDEAANDVVRRLFCDHFRQEMARWSREPYMKAVQGSIWEMVYAQGHHQTQVFPDVNEFFRCIGDPASNPTRHIALYSTGSVAAQKLIMQYTPYGDLNPYITAYFDPTIVGTKLAAKSYMRIRNMLAEQLAIDSPEQLKIVFLTDNTSEVSAADGSGAIDCPVLSVRPFNEWIKPDTVLSVPAPFVTSFTQLMRPDEQADYPKLVVEALEAMKDKES